MSLRRVCLFSVLATVLAVPVVPPKKLLPPCLSLDGTATKKDITEVLDDAKCEYDRELTLCYSKIGVKFLPGIDTLTPTFVNLYNGNIELLWMISQLGWLKDMCKQGVLKDLSSLHFCSNLKAEETFEHELIRIMGKIMSVLQLTEVVQFASSLDRMRGKDECLRVCGGRYNSVLCGMFTELANFIVIQENKLELQNPETTLNTTTAGSTQGVTQPISGNTQPETSTIAPNNQLGTLNIDVNQSDTPSPASLPEQPSTSDQPTGTTSVEEIRTLLHKLGFDKLDPQQLNFFLSRVASTNTPSPPTLSTATVITAVEDADMSVTVSPTTGKENDQSKEVSTANYSVSDDIGEAELDGTPERAAEPTIVDAGGDDWILDGDYDEEDDWEEDDGLDHQEDNLIFPSEQENGGVADSGQVELTTTEANNAEGQLAGVEAVYNDDEDGSSGSGYRSIHFFGILLVLVAFTVTAYLCVHHKKKIKETMKDYVSEGQKKKRTRGAYKPLLPGNK